MSLGDMLDFEAFNLKDMWEKIKDNPESLILGVDPVSTGLWNELGVGGGNQEPLVNFLGGPMGGDTLGIGSGGVYDRAQEAGIDTDWSNKSHDIAEVVAAFYGGQGAMNGLENAFGGGEGAAGGEGFSMKDFGQNLMQNPPQLSGPQQVQQTPQHVFNQQQLAPLMAPENEQEAQARNNAMSLLLQQHRG